MSKTWFFTKFTTMATATTPSLLNRPIRIITTKSPFFSTTISMNSTTTAVGSNSNSDPVSPPPTKTVRVMIKGRVQGVFYRNWTIENANGLGINGWVRNRRDGSVEALFSGDPDSVDEMEERCKRGPPEAMVTGFQVYPSDEVPGEGFDRKPTA